VGYFYITGTVLFTVYGQLILKWRMGIHILPADGDAMEKIAFLLKIIVLDPYIVSGLASAFIASLFWMLAVSRFELSFAYPFMSSAFVLVFILSVLLFGEIITWHKMAGLLLIISGIVMTSQSA